MRRKLHLAFDSLETIVLQAGIPTDYAIAGTKWADTHITYSIPADGTGWNGTADTLNATMTTDLGPDWQAQVDRAMQTWASAAGITLTKVADDGEPMGAPGKDQGDPRFGDIRLGGYSFSSNALLAQTYLPGPGSTLGGDMVINTAQPWGVSVDLYSNLVHEIGHALGLGHASVPGDVMYPQYQGVVTSLGAGDVAGIQALYGPPGVQATPTPVPPPVVVTPTPTPAPTPAPPPVVVTPALPAPAVPAGYRAYWRPVVVKVGHHKVIELRRVLVKIPTPKPVRHPAVQVTYRR